MNKTYRLIFSLVLAFASAAIFAQQPGMKANVVIVESVDDFQAWLRKAAADPANAGRYPPSLKEVPIGKKVHFPILVGGLTPPAQGVMNFVADVEFFAPGGKSIGAAKQCCRFTITDRPDYRTVMLAPTMNLELEANDPKGVYTVKVSVTDGSNVLTASETFTVIEGSIGAPAKSATPEKPSAPKLRMDAPAKDPGGNVDKRNCLDLPTPSEIIKCTEGK
ncbi:hypothetical protein BWI17_02175 [Betaproteobacteria bacterium GR16-43]|nr:hypothetical protein BWI17_02175 [Betaproteobacteria bacterium GR16-43]